MKNQTRIIVSHASSFDFKNELYKPIKEHFSTDCSFHFDFPHEASGEALRTKKIVSEADILIAEVSWPSIGTGIEIGWADCLEVPVVGFHREQFQTSSSLVPSCKMIVSYSGSEDLVKKIRKTLEDLQAMTWT